MQYIYVSTIPLRKINELQYVLYSNFETQQLDLGHSYNTNGYEIFI